MIEVAGEGHADARGDYKLGSQTYENNLLVDIEGPAIVLGKGDIRLHDITVRNNIFKDGKSGPAIQLSSAHWNLAIDNNVFYNQEDAILLKGQDGSTDAYQRKPSSISIQNNISGHPAWQSPEHITVSNFTERQEAFMEYQEALGMLRLCCW